MSIGEGEVDPDLLIDSQADLGWCEVSLRIRPDAMPEVLSALGRVMANNEVILISGAHTFSSATEGTPKGGAFAEAETTSEDFLDHVELVEFAAKNDFTAGMANRTWAKLEDAYKSKQERRQKSQAEPGHILVSKEDFPIELAGSYGGGIFPHALLSSLVPTAQWLARHPKGVLSVGQRELYLSFVNHKFDLEKPFDVPSKPNYEVVSFPDAKEFSLDPNAKYLSSAQSDSPDKLVLVTADDVIDYAKEELDITQSQRVTKLKAGFYAVMAAVLHAEDADGGTRYTSYFRSEVAANADQEELRARGLMRTDEPTETQRPQGDTWGLTPQALVRTLCKFARQEAEPKNYGPFTGHVLSRYINYLHKPTS